MVIHLLFLDLEGVLPLAGAAHGGRTAARNAVPSRLGQHCMYVCRRVCVLAWLEERACVVRCVVL